MKRLTLLAMFAAACGGDPVNAEGTWNVSGTNRTNDCGIGGWDENTTFTDVDLQIQQNGEAILADVTGGGSELYLGFLLGGDDVFRGTVDGDRLVVTREGTRSETMGNCTYTYNAEIDLDINGDAFSGRITYRRATNGNSDCEALQCASYQDLTGSRPPT